MNEEPRRDLMRPIRTAWLLVAAVLVATLCAPRVEAAEVRVMISGGLSAA